jgi:hypothetical protein
MAGTINRWARRAVVAALLAFTGAALVAAPVHVTVQDVGFVLAADNSYGGGNARLGVGFNETRDAPWIFDLSDGQALTFRFGTVTLDEEGGDHATLTPTEARQLGVQALFSFGTPQDGQQLQVGSTVTVMPGLLGDPGVGYAIHWNDAVLDFGLGGRLGLALGDVAFTANHTAQDQYATLTLLQAPATGPGTDPNGTPVDEPNLLPLAGLGLGAMALVRRWRREAG